MNLSISDLVGIMAILVHSSIASRSKPATKAEEFLPHIRLASDLVDKRRYDNRVRPVLNHRQPTVIKYSMSLYQILAIDERLQSIALNVWVIEKWHDEFLGWDPNKYGLINTTILPYETIWLPDTYVYNSVILSRDETEKYINAVVTTKYWEGKRGAEVMFMYPALYRTTCRLDVRFFPYDQQSCTLVISSWTGSKSDMDYEAEFDSVNLDNFIENEEWALLSFTIRRIEKKFACCPEPWALLEASLIVRRKPLYYIVNLIIPTSVITLVTVIGFFTPATTNNERRDKLSVGIDSLLALSFLMMMVGEQMPVTSEYVPLFGVFYLAILFIIFTGTMFTAFILNVHLQKIYTRPISPFIAKLFFRKAAPCLLIDPPATLLELWSETDVDTTEGNIKKVTVAINRKSGLIRSSEKNRRKIGRDYSVLRSQSSMARYSHDRKIRCGEMVNPATDHAKKDSAVKKLLPQLNTRSKMAKKNWRTLARTVSLRGCEINEANQAGDLRSRTATTSSIITSNPVVELVKVEMSLRRRYALEWEFLASILDRIFLILFVFVVLAVIGLMMFTGEAMHLEYDIAQQKAQLLQT